MGKIDIAELNVPPEKHEYETAKYFANRGYNVKFIKPSDVKGFNSPDFKMCGRLWEIKGPITYGGSSFEHVFRKAVRQSDNIIYDLRRLSERNEEKYLKELKRRRDWRKLRILLVITRDGRLLTVKGKFDNI